MFTLPNMSHVTCHVSRVTCHVSRVTCHMSRVTCHLFIFLLFFFLDKVVKLIGGGSVMNGAYPVQFNTAKYIKTFFLSSYVRFVIIFTRTNTHCPEEFSVIINNYANLSLNSQVSTTMQLWRKTQNNYNWHQKAIKIC